MSKAYIVTAVDYGETVDGKSRTIGVFFDPHEAQKDLNADMDNYKKAAGPNYEELELSIMEKNGDNGCEWNIEEKEVRIPLTPLQITHLNGIAAAIEKGEDDYFSYEDTLSTEEDEYLIGLLLNKGIVIDKKTKEELRGEAAREWIATHGKENG